MDIIVENHSNPDALSVVQFARAIEPYNIFFFEEPNTLSPKTARYISENTGILTVPELPGIGQEWSEKAMAEADKLPAK